MPQKLPPEIQTLVNVYHDAQDRIIAILARNLDLNNNTLYITKIQREVDAELAALDQFADAWTKEYIPKAYTKGVLQAYAEFKRLNLSFNAVSPVASVIETLVANSYEHLIEAHGYIGRMVRDATRKTGLEITASQIATGSTVRQAKLQMLDTFSKNGVVALYDRAGRQMKLDWYADLVARSTSREATNTGVINTAKRQGYDLVKMSTNTTTCPVCAAYEGRVYSISGDTPGYPRLDNAFSGPYANIHPNCSHVLNVYIPEMDENAAELKEYSNRSFDIDPRSKASIERYNQQQRVKVERNRDRKQYERYKLVNVDNLPKSFSGFRASKTANSERWRMMQEDYRDTMKQIRTQQQATST